jgi:hypothetical protein
MNEISEYEYKQNKVRITYIPERGGFFVSVNNCLLPGKFRTQVEALQAAYNHLIREGE